MSKELIYEVFFSPQMGGVEENKVPRDPKVKENKRKAFLVSLKHAGGRFNKTEEALRMGILQSSDIS